MDLLRYPTNRMKVPGHEIIKGERESEFMVSVGQITGLSCYQCLSLGWLKLKPAVVILYWLSIIGVLGPVLINVHVFKSLPFDYLSLFGRSGP